MLDWLRSRLNRDAAQTIVVANGGFQESWTPDRVYTLNHAIELGNARLTVLSLECFSDRSRLRYEATADETKPTMTNDDPVGLWDRWVFHLQDDAGTEYFRYLGGGGGGDLDWSGHLFFRPAPPESASSITLYVYENLRSRPFLPQFGTARPDAGPIGLLRIASG